jgi:hypothetical protein
MFQTDLERLEPALRLKRVGHSLLLATMQVFHRSPPSHYSNGKRVFLGHIPFQFVDLCMEHQVNDFIGCDYTIELLIKASKGATELGQHQGTKEPQRIERSVAMAMMAYLTFLKFRAHDIPEKGPWSVFTLQQNCTWQITQAQRERMVEQRLYKRLQERKVASSTSSTGRFQGY